MNWFKQWRLRRARERYVYWKAKSDELATIQPREFCFFSDWNLHRERLADSKGLTAKYEERVEQLMR